MSNGLNIIKKREISDDEFVELTLAGQTLSCRVKEVIDCTTFRVFCYFYGVPVKVLCKFDGICCANPLSTNESEKRIYEECEMYLKTLLVEEIVKIEFLGVDRFGKYITNVFLNEKLVNQTLIEKNYAYNYRGGKKLSFSQWGPQELP